MNSGQRETGAWREAASGQGPQSGDVPRPPQQTKVEPLRGGVAAAQHFLREAGHEELTVGVRPKGLLLPWETECLAPVSLIRDPHRGSWRLDNRRVEQSRVGKRNVQTLVDRGDRHD
jgi:hypothetical protein